MTGVCTRVWETDVTTKLNLPRIIFTAIFLHENSGNASIFLKYLKKISHSRKLIQQTKRTKITTHVFNRFFQSSVRILKEPFFQEIFYDRSNHLWVSEQLQRFKWIYVSYVFMVNQLKRFIRNIPHGIH